MSVTDDNQINSLLNQLSAERKKSQQLVDEINSMDGMVCDLQQENKALREKIEELGQSYVTNHTRGEDK